MSKSRRKQRKTDRTSVRVSGREMPVVDRMTIGRRTYLILQRMGGEGRERLMAFDPYAGPDGDLRAILILPRSKATQQHVRVLKRAAGGDNLPTILEYHTERDRLLLVLKWGYNICCSL